mmetsp:Transcript_31255/g.38632  ORF Transcript_31255/g.38632 Transcript_31255/m.38632 type:complete len:140 (-) Transcript_31255:1447-1866(-)
MTIYAVIKFDMLINRSNPNVSSYVNYAAKPQNQKFNLLDNGFRIAFGIEGFLDKELRDDPRFVKWIVRYFGIDKNGAEYEKLLPFHKCEKADYEKFQAPGQDQQYLFEKFVSGERSLFCLDWDELGDELEIWGVEVAES